MSKQEKSRCLPKLTNLCGQNLEMISRQRDIQQVKITTKLTNLLCLHFSKVELDKLGRVINSASHHYYLQHELLFHSSRLHN